MNDRSYTKLFSKIVTSSMWSLSAETRVVWVTMLAIMDQYSEVHASIPGLARTANVSVEACQEALNIFLNPDPFSRTKTHEGRRIKPIEDGWLLLNGDLYKAMMTAEERREYKRIKEAERRARKRGQRVDNHGQIVDSAWTNPPEADPEADPETGIKRGKNSCPPVSRAEFDTLAELEAVPNDCRDWVWDEHQSTGWLDKHGRAYSDIRALLRKHKRTFEANAKNGKRLGGSSILDLKTQKKAIEDLMEGCKGCYDREFASNEELAEAKQLKADLAEINRKIRSHGRPSPTP